MLFMLLLLSFSFAFSLLIIAAAVCVLVVFVVCGVGVVDGVVVGAVPGVVVVILVFEEIVTVVVLIIDVVLKIRCTLSSAQVSPAVGSITTDAWEIVATWRSFIFFVFHHLCPHQQLMQELHSNGKQQQLGNIRIPRTGLAIDLASHNMAGSLRLYWQIPSSVVRARQTLAFCPGD